MNGNGNGTRPTLAEDAYAGLLIDRLAATIVDDSLPLKEVERELRGCVADVAVHRRGLCKRETASRCGVTEKSIENYLKEVRSNPKSPEREIARILQDRMLTLEEIHEQVRPALGSSRNFGLDDARRALDKLLRTGEVERFPGSRYRAIARPAIRSPATVDAHRELVDEKARDLDYIVLRQKDATEEDIEEQRSQRYSRVVGDTSLVRVDFTVDCTPDELPAFYEELSQGIAKLTMKYEKKNGPSRVRLLLGLRSVVAALAFVVTLLIPVTGSWASGSGKGEGGDSWELDSPILRGDVQDSSSPHAGSTASNDSEPTFLMGDVDLDERVGITDAIRLARYLSGEPVILPCARTADVNYDDRVTVADILVLFENLFGSSRPHGTGAAEWGVERVHPSDSGNLGCDAAD